MLVQYGADVNFKNKSGKTAYVILYCICLHDGMVSHKIVMSTETDNKTRVGYFISAGYPVNYSMLAGTTVLSFMNAYYM